MATREYARVYAALVRKEKWLDLSWSAKAAWIELYLQSIQTEGSFDSRSQVEKILRRAGSRNPAGDVDALVTARLLDVVGDGMAMHDWQDHQAHYRGPSDDPAAVAERVRKHRAEQAARRNDHVTNGTTSNERRPRKGRNDHVTNGNDGIDRGEEKRGDSVEVTQETKPARANGHPSTNEPRLSKEQAEAWESYANPAWAPFKAEWLGRGLRWPPRGEPDTDDASLRALLWQIADARPNDLAAWVRDAKGSTQHAIVGYVLERWHAIRAGVAATNRHAPVEDSDDEAIWRPTEPVVVAS